MTIKKWLAIVVVLLCPFLSAAFSNMAWNPADWGYGYRVVVGFVTASLLAVIAVGVSSNDA